MGVVCLIINTYKYILFQSMNEFIYNWIAMLFLSIN